MSPRQRDLAQPELFVSEVPAPPRVPNEAARVPSVHEEPAPGSTPASAIGVATLTATIRDILEGAFPRLWIRGEVSDFKQHRRGHWYFSLRDESALVRCVMWESDTRRMVAPPDEGMEVIALGQVSMYAGRGEMQVVVTRIRSVGDGLWRKAFDVTRQRLEAEGLLAPARKRPLPRFPRCIAIVTSADGAALHDIIAVVRARFPIVQLMLVPAAVQGEHAPQSLCAALARLTKWGGADLLIIGRGGGSREELWAFNDERVARALAACPIPTISAVGHEVDITICDLVADRRAATPSAAAELAVPVLRELRSLVSQRAHLLRRHVERRASLGAERLEGIGQALTAHAQRVVQARRLRLQAVAGRLDALSPLGTLRRGYAVVLTPDDTPVTDVRTLAPGDTVRVRLRDGSFAARVESTSPGDSA